MVVCEVDFALGWVHFITDSELLVVCDDEPSNLISRAADIEDQNTQIIWKMSDHDEEDLQSVMYIKEATMMDNKAQAVAPEERHTHLINTVLMALCLIIVTALLGLAARALAIEIAAASNLVRTVSVA